MNYREFGIFMKITAQCIRHQILLCWAWSAAHPLACSFVWLVVTPGTMSVGL